LAQLADTHRPAAVLLGILTAALAAAVATADRDTSDSLTVLSSDLRGSKRVPAEAEWANGLLEVFGLDEILPPEYDPAEGFALLCPDRAELVTEGGGRRVPARSSLRVTLPAAPDRGPGEPVRMVVDVPATALYSISVEGVGMQRWLIDGHLLGHLDPSALGIAQVPHIVPLREGPHELAGYLTPRARVDQVEIAAQRSLCIAPADGWHPDRPLRYGSMARTLVHALGLEKNLPEAGEGVPVEGEAFGESSGGAERSEKSLLNEPSGRAWARAANGPAEFTYRLYLEDPGLFSIIARLPGGGAQVWSVDGRYRASLRPAGPGSAFEWNHVLTLPLASGEHVLRVFATRGSGIDRIRLVPHQPTDLDYVHVMAREGFADGAPDAMVTHRVARRSLALALERSGGRFFSDHAQAGGRSGLLDRLLRPQREVEPPPAAPDPDVESGSGAGPAATGETSR
jgi:hypothetical protein